MRLIPTDDHIFLEEIPEPAPLIVRVEGAATDERVKKRATVLAVGPGVVMPNGVRGPMPCAAGDVVLVNAGAGFKVKHDGTEYWVVYGSHRDVIAVEGADAA